MGRRRTLCGRRIAAAALCAAMGLAAIAPPAARAQAKDAWLDFAPYANIQVDVDGPVDQGFAAQEKKYDAPLTSTEGWRGFDSQGGRDITVDLTYDRPVVEVSIEMLQKPAWGVFYPEHVDFEAYVNGKWVLLGTRQTAIPTWDPRQTTQVFSVSAPGVMTHLVRIHFPVAAWVFVRHLQVICDMTAQPSYPDLPALPAVPAPFTQPMTALDARAHGIHNMLLVYTGSHGQQGTWTADDFLPATGYLMPNGEIGGRMFDTMLFLPYGDVPDTQMGWQKYLQSLFAHGVQLEALDAAAAQTNNALQRFGGNPPGPEQVVIGIPYPRFGDGRWGTVDGHTISFQAKTGDPAAVSARLQAVGWFVRSVLSRWRQAGLPHLKLAGFYWTSEAVRYKSPGDTELIQGTAALVHQAGLPLFWIPYYYAPGLEDWQQLGFDAAWLQLNYVFLGEQAYAERLTNAEALAARNGTGIELELPSQALTSPLYRGLYVQSLRQMQNDGFAGIVSHAFYAGSKLLSQAARSPDPAVRALYDATYGFLYAG
ncbi:DUF4855 domain-containing protein [Alicyclobacillus cellulosilyticus]|nr:DUF4855 domain-containing protein [Alicyclobacillus cellulosilyticus]